MTSPAPPAITHVALTVSDLDRSIAWYTAVWGEAPVFRGEFLAGTPHHYSAAVWRTPNLGLHCFAEQTDGAFSARRPGLDHVAFEVDADDLDTWVAHLDSLGVSHGEILAEPYGSGLASPIPTASPSNCSPQRVGADHAGSLTTRSLAVRGDSLARDCRRTMVSVGSEQASNYSRVDDRPHDHRSASAGGPGRTAFARRGASRLDTARAALRSGLRRRRRSRRSGAAPRARRRSCARGHHRLPGDVLRRVVGVDELHVVRLGARLRRHRPPVAHLRADDRRARCWRPASPRRSRTRTWSW